MIFADTDHEWLDACIVEAKRLQAEGPDCHALRNELGALQMLKDLLAEGVPLDREMAMNCLARMRTAIARGDMATAVP